MYIRDVMEKKTTFRIFTSLSKLYDIRPTIFLSYFTSFSELPFNSAGGGQNKKTYLNLMMKYKYGKNEDLI